MTGWGTVTSEEWLCSKDVNCCVFNDGVTISDCRPSLVWCGEGEWRIGNDSEMIWKEVVAANLAHTRRDWGNPRKTSVRETGVPGDASTGRLPSASQGLSLHHSAQLLVHLFELHAHMFRPMYACVSVWVCKQQHVLRVVYFRSSQNIELRICIS